MNKRITIGLCFSVLLIGFLLGPQVFVSKTEQILFLVYTGVLILTIWKRSFLKLFYYGAFGLIVLATLMYLYGPTMVRYSHYIDKASLWAYYFFATGIMVSLLNNIGNRSKNKK